MSLFTVDHILLLLIAGVSAVMDLHETQIKNGWILCSLFSGLIFQIWQKGVSGAAFFTAGAFLPLVLLGILFVFRMIGAGDIKLFCALGGIMGPSVIVRCVGVSFLAGAGISLALMLSLGEFRYRFCYLAEYLRRFILTGKREPYCRRGMALENIHFTVPVFMSVMLYTGGIY